MALYFRSLGKGPPLILLHGLFGSSDNWVTFAKKLASDYQVWLLDLPNHGRSPHTHEFSFESLAAQVLQFIKQHGWEHVYLVGHSLGGKVGIQMLQHEPSLIKAIAILDIHFKAYSGGHEIILDALLKLPLHSLTSRQDAEDWLKEHLPDAGIRQFLLKNLYRSGESFSWKFNLPVINHNYKQVLKAIPIKQPVETPSLFLRGGNSAYILDEDIPLIHAVFNQVDIETIPEAGHWIHVDAPDELFLHLLRFFKRHSS